MIQGIIVVFMLSSFLWFSVIRVSVLGGYLSNLQMFFGNDIDESKFLYFLLFSLDQARVRIAETGAIFDFFEAIEVELSDKAAQFIVTEICWQDFLLQFISIENVNFCFWLFIFYDTAVLLVLNGFYFYG